MNDSPSPAPAGAAPTLARPAIILVLGMHRSGTSALTRTISLLGAALPGELIPASQTSNPAGHWESRAVQQLNDQLLQALGSRWDDWRRLTPSTLLGPAGDGFRAAALEILEREAASSTLFVLKDPRICRLLPFWLDVLDRFGSPVHCVLAWRDAAGVAASLQRRNRFDPAQSQRMWLRHVLDAEEGSRGRRRTLVAYDELLSDWRDVARRLATDLGIAWPRLDAAQAQIDTFIGEPSTGQVAAATTNPPEWVAQLTQLLAGLRNGADLDSAGPAFDQLRREIDRAEQVFPPAPAAEPDAEARKQELATCRTYIHALENAARIRDVQLKDGADVQAQADRRIAELEALLRLPAATDPPQASELLHKLQLTQLDQARTALQARRVDLSLGRPPQTRFGTRLGRRERQALRSMAQALLDSGLFDPLWYLQAYPDVLSSGSNPVWHWLYSGCREGRQPNPLFDTSWYLATYPDAAASALDPLSYHLQLGTAKGHAPGPLFSAGWYLDRNADVARAGIDPLQHWLLFGSPEGRAPGPWFDTRWYLDQNPDVAESGLPALNHYLLVGGIEGRDPCAAFASRWYLRRYPDVRGNPLLHFLRHGLAEHRQPLPPAGDYRPGQTADGLFDPQSAFAGQLNVSDQLLMRARQRSRDDARRFSIIMPSWNRREPLVAAIDSVLAQSYPAWELIVCDDGSTDGTEAALRDRYADALSSGRIVYLALPHQGAAAARNAGLRVAQGDWIAYLDSDNRWHPDYLLTIAAACAEQPMRRAAYACLRVDDSVQDRSYVRYAPFSYARLVAHNYIDLNVFVHARGLYEQLGGFDESLRRLIDWDLILRYTRVYEPLLVPHVLCDYRISRALGNVSLTEALADNETRIRRRHAVDTTAFGAAPLRLACILPAWPPAPAHRAMLDALQGHAVDVRVYCFSRPLAPAEPRDVPVTEVANAAELQRALDSDQRNWIHAVEPDASAMRQTVSAAEHAGIAYSIGIGPRSGHVAAADAATSELCAAVLGTDEAAATTDGKLLLHGVNDAAEALLDCSARPPLDLFSVTRFSDQEADAMAAAEATLRNVLDRTTTPLVLTIVDDGSGEAWRRRLAEMAKDDARLRLVPLKGSQGFAHCANLALSLARSAWVIHLSSRGGPVVRTGWEQACLRYMRAHPACAMAGAADAAATLDGRSLLRQPWFAAFRETSAARRAPDDRITQLHTSLLVMRRDVFEKEGGFSGRVPTEQCIREYLHFVAGRGWRTGVIAQLHALDPDRDARLDPRLDETMLALAGGNAEAPALLAHCAASPLAARCNVCGWTGDIARDADSPGFSCPACHSTPRDRAALRWLSATGLDAQRRTLDGRGLGTAVRQRLETGFLLREGAAEVEIPDTMPLPASRALGIPATPPTGSPTDT